MTASAVNASQTKPVRLGPSWVKARFGLRHDERWQWAESISLTLLAAVFVLAVRPADPLLQQADFPWLMFAPVLVALRYGVAQGVGSIAILLLDWWQFTPATEFPTGFFFGQMILTMVCGEFSSVWQVRIKRSEETTLYLDERLSRLTKRHLLLRLSHDRLEQEMLAKPGSLRDAIINLRQLTMDGWHDGAKLPAAMDLLQLLTQYAQLEAAALYLVKTEDGKESLGTQVESIGSPVPLVEDDPLFAAVLEHRELAHVAQGDTGERISEQLVVAPLLASDGTLLGVLSISRMPFFALNEETLQMVSLMLAYYADIVRVGPAVREIARRLPGCPNEFIEEFARLQRLQRSHDLASHVVTLAFSGPMKDEIPEQIRRMKRGLDIVWITRRGDTPVLVNLMPFATEAAKDGYLLRIENWLKEHHGGNYDDLYISTGGVDLGTADTLDALANLVFHQAGGPAA